MTGDVVAKALAAACGETREGAEADVAGGIVPAFVVAPGSTDEAAAVLRAAAEHELAVVARGAGGRLGWGVPPSRCDLMIDMSRMSSVVEHSAGDLVARVQALFAARGRVMPDNNLRQADVPVGARIRLAAALGAVEDAGVNAVQVVADFTIEVEGAAKPACVAQAIYRYYA